MQHLTGVLGNNAGLRDETAHSNDGNGRYPDALRKRRRFVGSDSVLSSCSYLCPMIPDCHDIELEEEILVGPILILLSLSPSDFNLA